MDEFAMPESVEQYMPVTVSFSYYNTGKVALNNVMFKVEGDVDCSQRSTYVGNMDPGASDYYEVTFTPNTIGEVPVSIVATYEDASGETIEQRRDYVLNVTEPMMPEGEEDGAEPPQNGLTMKNIIIGIGVIVILGMGLFLFIRGQKKDPDGFAESMDFDDEDEELEDDDEDDDDKEGMPL